MKTKLATLLIAPALLFTACGAKEISVKEAFQYAKEHFTVGAEKDGKASYSWDLKDSNEFGASLLAELIDDELGLEIDPTKIKGNVEGKEVTDIDQIVIGEEASFEKFQKKILSYCPFNTKFYMPNNNLNVKGEKYAGEGGVFLTVHTSATFDEKGYVKEIIADCEKFSGDVEIDKEKQTIVMAGTITATFTLND